ncbi:hypothetical protein C9374_001338 [Naegleria lovaniensis]|uniref:Sugar phosphate transporter domain-containing protein n=1 Tax=Naegleria lovaniensis TaxID=51637 RepID=A0AA88KN81_NAELO|nr:uncharacterized protein C9374_001338 [Naegleria lovaniensis]KAG2387744.1 hypothetical protein C9374_001338 [Naegleria lovaniensis]
MSSSSMVGELSSRITSSSKQQQRTNHEESETILPLSKSSSPIPSHSPSSSSLIHNKHHSQKDASKIQVLFAIIFFIITSISSLFFSKYLMDIGEYTFPFPLTMTWSHLLVALICILCTYSLNRTFCFSFLPDFEFKIETAIQIMPVSLLYVGMVTFNNLCLDYSDIHVYHTARSISICFTALFTFVLLGEHISKRIIFACFIIAIGYFMAGIKETQLSKINLVGFAFGLVSSCFMALYSIYLKKIMSSTQKNHWIILIYNTIGAILFLFPICVMTGEFEKASAVPFLFEPKFLIILIGTGFVAFIVNISNFVLISRTSPLSTSVIVTLKSVIESVLSLSLHRSEGHHHFFSTYSIASTLFTLLGSYLFTLFKLQDERKRNEESLLE